MMSFIKGLRGEFKKIVWPSRKTLIKQTVTVMIVSGLVGLIIAIVDMIMNFGYNAIIDFTL